MLIEEKKIQGNMIEYLDDCHTYLVNGVVVPSVSQLLKKVFPNKYNGIPKKILEAKAEYGTTVHEAIERLEKFDELPNMNIHQKLAIDQYKKLKATHGFKVEEQEEIVCYKDKFCGRFDMTIELVDETVCFMLADIKTTSTLDREYIAWQMSLYELAYEYTFGTEQFVFDGFRCIWLPKGDIGQFVEIKRIERDLLLEVLSHE